MRIFSLISGAAMAALVAAPLAGCAPAAHSAGPAGATAAAKPAQPGDFNGDGRRDLVAASPYGWIGNKAKAGFVTVIYGRSAKRQVIDRYSPGVPGIPRYLDHFGLSTASADFDKDGYADLAIGSLGQHHGVTILYGGPGGLTGRSITLSVPGAAVGRDLAVGDFDRNGGVDLIATGTLRREEFYEGAAYWTFRDVRTKAVSGVRTAVQTRGEDGLAAWMKPVVADFDGDRYPDLALSVAGNMDGETVAARVILRRGSAKGLGASKVVLTKAGPALAAGDINGDGRADLVAGGLVTDDQHGYTSRIHVLAGRAGGLGKPTTFSQRTSGVPGTDEAGDRFGGALAVGDINGDGRADVAIGVPGEDVGKTADAGAVTVLYGTSAGLGTRNAQLFGQNTAGFPDSPERRDRFGETLLLADLNGDGRADLAIGVPGENAPNGRIHLLYGRPAGLTVKGVTSFNPAALGLSGRRAQLGSHLS